MFRYFCSCSDICKYPGSVVLVSPGRVVVVLTLQLGTAGPGPDTVIVMKSDPICNKTPHKQTTLTLHYLAAPAPDLLTRADLSWLELVRVVGGWRYLECPLVLAELVPAEPLPAEPDLHGRPLVLHQLAGLGQGVQHVLACWLMVSAGIWYLAWLVVAGGWYLRSEVIFKKSSNLYCRLNLGRVLMVGTKVSKGFFV